MGNGYIHSSSNSKLIKDIIGRAAGMLAGEIGLILNTGIFIAPTELTYKHGNRYAVDI